MNEELIINNINLIYYILKKMGLYDKREIYYDIGLLGLVKAADTFIEDKGYTFSTYAGNCIMNEIRHHVRKEKANKRKANYNTISLDEPIYNDEEGHEMTLLDTLNSDIDIEKELIDKEQKELMYKALSNLNKTEISVLNYYYGLNGFNKLKQREIAEELNITQTYVSRIINKSIKKIKEMVNQ